MKISTSVLFLLFSVGLALAGWMLTLNTWADALKPVALSGLLSAICGVGLAWLGKSPLKNGNGNGNQGPNSGSVVPRSSVAISAVLLVVSLACVPTLMGQTPPPTPAELNELVAAGASWNQSGSPQFSGTIIYAHRVSTGLFSFSVVDIFSLPTVALPDSPDGLPKFSITTSTTTGLAQFLRSVGPVKIYIIGTIGAAAGGTQVGWAYTTGGCAYIPIGKSLSIIPSFRALKSSLSGDYQGIYGIAFGWGK